MPRKTPASKLKARKLVNFVLAKKANNPVILDVTKISSICDYFIVCSADNSRQVKAISDELTDRASAEGITVHHKEQDSPPQWILMDFFDVIVHIFVDEARQFYQLEHLWREARRIK